MQFGDLTKAIGDAWTFSWPPIALCAIAYWVGRYMHPGGTRELLRRIAATTEHYGGKIDAARSILEPYGLTRIVPIASAVVVVGCMYMLNLPVTTFVSKLPPYVTYQPERLIKKSVQEDQRFLLVRKYPHADSFGDAFYMALFNITKDEKPPQIKRSEFWYKTQNMAKFAAVVALVAFFFGIRSENHFFRRTGRLLTVLATAACWWAVSFAGTLYRQQQDYLDLWAPINQMLQKESESGTLAQRPITPRESAKIALGSDCRWWRVDVLDFETLQWLRENFLTGPAGSSGRPAPVDGCDMPTEKAAIGDFGGFGG